MICPTPENIASNNTKHITRNKYLKKRFYKKSKRQHFKKKKKKKEIIHIINKSYLFVLNVEK